MRPIYTCLMVPRHSHARTRLMVHTPSSGVNMNSRTHAVFAVCVGTRCEGTPLIQGECHTELGPILQTCQRTHNAIMLSGVCIITQRDHFAWRVFGWEPKTKNHAMQPSDMGLWYARSSLCSPCATDARHLRDHADRTR